MVLAGALLIVIKSFSQGEKNKNAGYEKNPAWIYMMSDTLTNYFEATKAFEAYWKIRPKPVEEEDIIGHTEIKKNERQNWLQKIFVSKREQRSRESELYSFQYKKFKNWQRAMQPYVQDDGSILTPSQRIALWKAQQSK